MGTVGVELELGVLHDSRFGSLVVLAAGGTTTELKADRSFRAVPPTDVDAAAMWHELRCAPLLTGYRRSVWVDLPALEDVVLRVEGLAEDLPEVPELDLNPVLATPQGVVVADAKLHLRSVAAEPDGWVRSLDPVQDDPVVKAGPRRRREVRWSLADRDIWR